MSMRMSTLLAGAALVPVISASLATAACAQAVQDFDISPGSLDGALIQYAEQAGLQLLYPADLVAGRSSPGLVGRYTREAALEALLRGSGLTARETGPGVLTLRASPRASVEAPTQVADIVVTGSLIRGPGETPSPVTVISRDDLDRQGFATAAEALVALPQSYAGGANPGAQLSFNDSGGSNSALATGVNLRGLGEDSTLVLVNGRRMAGTGLRGEFADLSTIPGAALERIDILLDGASALYGSDAVGGVVNVILKRTYEGQESRVRVSAAQGGAEDVLASHLIGRRWSSGGILASYEYQHSQALNSADRPYTATGDLRPWGGADYRSLYGAPANIARFDAAAGVYVSSFAIRPGPDGVARTPADFAAGQTNLSNRRSGVDLLPAQTRQTAYVSARQDLASWLEVSADLRWSERDYRYESLSAGGLYTVNRANPFFVSPNGSTSHLIAYDFARDMGNTRREGNSRSLGATAGLDADLPGGWTLEAYGAWAEERSTGGQFGHVNTTFLNEALGTTADNPATAFSAPRDGYLNLFGSGDANTAAVLAFISQGFDQDWNTSRVTTGNALVSGTVVQLPGGPLKLAAGVHYRHESFQRESISFRSGLTPVLNVGAPQDREIVAGFLELRAPIVGDDNPLPGVRRLELSLAGRIEDYSDFGSTTNPKLGLLWAPVEGLRTRASWGTSFRAPSLTELYERVQIGAAPLASPTGSQLAILHLGGNESLRPEEADTLSVGFDVGDREGLRFSATYSDTRFEDRIGRPASTNLTTVLSNPSLAPFVTYVNPAVPADLALIQSFITSPAYLTPGLYPATSFRAIVDGRWVNTGEVRVRGVDLSGGYGLERDGHHIDLDVSAAYVLEYSRRQTPAAARESLADVVGFPADLRVRASVQWSRLDWSARLGANYVDNYYAPTGREIAGLTTIDAQVRWSPSTGIGQGIDVALSAQNLFDKDPPFYDNPQGFGFDPANASPLGRVVSLQLTKRW